MRDIVSVTWSCETCRKWVTRKALLRNQDAIPAPGATKTGYCPHCRTTTTQIAMVRDG